MMHDSLIHSAWEPGLLEYIENGEIKYSRLVNSRQPILSAEKPWEYHWLALGRNSVMYDEQENLFKMWYLAADPDHPERKDWYAKTFLRCYAVSEDGINWQRPNLRLFSYRDSNANNIISQDIGDGFFGSIVKDPTASDPSRLYKSIGFGEYRDGPGVYTGISGDGINWTRETRIFDSSEATDGASLYGRHPFTNQWMSIIRPRTNPKKRFIGISFSADFRHWTVPQVVLAAGRNDEIDVEYDNLTLCGLDHYFVGLIGKYHTNPEDQRYNSGLAFSYDARHWFQPNCRTILETSADGNWDDSMVRPSSIIRKDDDLYIYYWGANRGQGTKQVRVPAIGSRFNGKTIGASIGVIKMPVHRFAFLEARSPEICLAETKFLYAQATDLYLNADTVDGQIRIQVLDHQNNPLPGLQFDDFIPIKEQNSTHIKCVWKGKKLDHFLGKCDCDGKIGRVIKIVFELSGSKLYSFSFR